MSALAVCSFKPSIKTTTNEYKQFLFAHLGGFYPLPCSSCLCQFIDSECDMKVGSECEDLSDFMLRKQHSFKYRDEIPTNSR